MDISKEEQFIKIIRFTPAVFVLVVSFFVVLFLYFENKRTFHEEKKSIEEQFINENKEIIKDEVNRVYTFIKHLQETTEIELKKICDASGFYYSIHYGKSGKPLPFDPIFCR